MKNKKRCIALILCITILMLSLYVPVSTVQAADNNKVYNAFTVSVKGTSPVDGKAQQSKSIQINYDIKFNKDIQWPKFSGTNDTMGVNVIRGVIEYDANIFEEMQIKTTANDEEGSPIAYNLTYLGSNEKNQIPVSGQADWNGVVKINPEHNVEQDTFSGKVKFVIQAKSYTLKDRRFDANNFNSQTYS